MKIGGRLYVLCASSLVGSVVGESFIPLLRYETVTGIVHFTFDVRKVNSVRDVVWCGEGRRCRY